MVGYVGRYTGAAEGKDNKIVVVLLTYAESGYSLWLQELLKAQPAIEPAESNEIEFTNQI